MTPPDAATAGRRLRRVCVLIDIADRALRADTADACDEAGIAVAADRASGDADVILVDRPVATALPAIALAAEGSSSRSWPAGICAVVPADLDAETLAAVITVVAAGYALTARADGGDGAVTDEKDEDGDGYEARDAGAGRALSSREREVLARLAEGASNKEIALALGLSVSTVKFHVATITGKLGARSRVDAVAIAVRAGLVML